MSLSVCPEKEKGRLCAVLVPIHTVNFIA